MASAPSDRFAAETGTSTSASAANPRSSAPSWCQPQWPLLHQAIDFVARAQIRNRGTVGGSIAHADPAAELPVALAALDGTVLVRSRRGERTVPWNELFVTHLTTSLEPDELLVEVIVPPLPQRHHHHRVR